MRLVAIGVVEGSGSSGACQSTGAADHGVGMGLTNGRWQGGVAAIVCGSAVKAVIALSEWRPGRRDVGACCHGVSRRSRPPSAARVRIQGGEGEGGALRA